MSKAYKVTVDTKTFIRFWLVILGFAIAGILIAKAATGLLIIGAALFFALAINPLVRKLADLIPGDGIKLPIAIAYILVVGFLSAFLAIVVPTVINETVNFARNLPETIDNVSQSFSWLNDFGQSIGYKHSEVLSHYRQRSWQQLRNQYRRYRRFYCCTYSSARTCALHAH